MYSLNRTTTSINTKVKPSVSNTSKTILKVGSIGNENVSGIPKALPRPKAILKPYQGTLTRSSSLRSKSVSTINLLIIWSVKFFVKFI